MLGESMIYCDSVTVSQCDTKTVLDTFILGRNGGIFLRVGELWPQLGPTKLPDVGTNHN